MSDDPRELEAVSDPDAHEGIGDGWRLDLGYLHLAVTNLGDRWMWETYTGDQEVESEGDALTAEAAKAAALDCAEEMAKQLLASIRAARPTP